MRYNLNDCTSFFAILKFATWFTECLLYSGRAMMTQLFSQFIHLCLIFLQTFGQKSLSTNI